MYKAVKLGAGILLFATAVSAQPSTPAAPSLPGTTTSTELSVGSSEVVNAQTMFGNARTFLKQMNETLQRIDSLLEQARRKRDIIMVNCLADKLVQARSNAELSQKAYLGMQQEMSAQNEPSAFSHYKRMTVANLNLQVIGTEAETCIGEDFSMVSGIRVDVHTDGVPPGDFTQPGAPEPPEINRPPHASPYF
jgi:hypothetical protein